MNVKIEQGDLLAQTDLDVIVNAANSHLRHGGGIARAIADAADPPTPPRVGGVTMERIALWRADHATAPLIATGDAWLTSPGLLPFDAVIHAVGPVWGGGGYHEADLLASALRRALLIADHHGYERIGVPAISAGIFGYPVDLAAQVLVKRAVRFAPRAVSLIECRFVLFTDEHYEAFADAAAV